MNGMMNGSLMGGMMLTMALGTLLMVVLVVVGIVALVRTTGVGTWVGRDDPVRILQERFARGEIDHEEYQERRATLQQRH